MACEEPRGLIAPGPVDLPCYWLEVVRSAARGVIADVIQFLAVPVGADEHREGKPMPAVASLSPKC